ncbi:recombinase family protein [Nocardioides bruguierae]|uniref:Recombinase family protein n=1 Tax=Nocardioides bruguierae TaxID=2945102 RepID=A0A9X2D6D7_9ACTN|nr:recombinase family protein [Nocardioides bruguierae]MCM0620028.1 recombinase family protein [Nocardioides bruguierae]
MAKKSKVADPGVVVAYTRVSTGDQVASGAGLDSQQDSIGAEVSRRGWTLLETYTDAGVSGKSIANRPALAEALEAVESGQAGTLVVAKLDRLSRSLLDFAELMARAQCSGWNLVALDLGIDVSTPAGEFLASVMASAAQWERRIIGQRTKDALAAKKAAGVRLGRPSVVPAGVLDRIAHGRSSGRSLRAIAADLTAAGVPTARGGTAWSGSSVQAIIASQAFADRLRTDRGTAARL